LKVKTTVVTHIVSGGLASQGYGQARLRNIEEADAVFANNGYLAQLVKEKLGVDAGTIHNGRDSSYFCPPSARPGTDPITVLYAGSMRPHKRVPLLVSEAARWPGARFRIAGTGEESGVCKRLAADLNCANVEFLGHLPLPQLGDEMRSADIFFFPS